jgi:hypothetical protein
VEEAEFERQLLFAPVGLVRLEANLAILVVAEFAQFARQGVGGCLVRLGGELLGAHGHVVEAEGQRGMGRSQRQQAHGQPHTAGHRAGAAGRGGNSVWDSQNAVVGHAMGPPEVADGPVDHSSVPPRFYPPGLCQIKTGNILITFPAGITWVTASIRV